MTPESRWRKVQRFCEWPIALIAFGGAILVLAYRLGGLAAYKPLAIWSAALVAIVAGAATVAFVASGVARLWAAHAGEGDVGQRAIRVLKAGLKLNAPHRVCPACVGRGFTWTLLPTETPANSAGYAAQSDLPARLKIECPSCGGGGFVDS